LNSGPEVRNFNGRHTPFIGMIAFPVQFLWTRLQDFHGPFCRYGGNLQRFFGSVNHHQQFVNCLSVLIFSLDTI
jgi:hypothetical protein